MSSDPQEQRELLIAAAGIVVGVLISFNLALSMASKRVTTANPQKDDGIQAAAHPDGAAMQALVEDRRSVQPKDMTGGLVPDEHVRAILKSAPWAPNHGKTEPWRFVTYAGKKGIEKLLDATLAWYEAQPAKFWKENFVLPSTGQPEFADFAAFATYYRKAAVDKWGQASHIVLIGVKRQPKVEGKKQHPTWEEDCAVACAVQNMHLLATSLGVGAYWSSWYAHYREANECVTDQFGLEPHLGDRCLGAFVIGERKPGLKIKAARKPLEEIMQWRA